MRSALLAVLCAAGSVCGEDIANPEFASWSKFKTGTSVTVRTTTTANKVATVSAETTKLVEAGPDKVQLEKKVNTAIQGKDNKVTLPAITIKRNSPFIGMPEDEGKKGKPRGTYEEGTETLKVGGIEIKTKWYKSAWTDPSGAKTEAKHWLSDEVPGGLVRMQSTVTPGRPNAVKYQLDRELIELDRK